MAKPMTMNAKHDPYPEVTGGDKEALRISTTSTLRKRTPTNLNTAAKVPNFVFDHSRQVPVWPNGKPDALIESTHATRSNDNYDTMNRSGRPFALGVDVGGSPDDPSNPYRPSKRVKIIRDV
jgi:hypothetical protein